MIKRCLDATGAVDDAGKQDIIIFGCLFVNMLAGIHKNLIRNMKLEIILPTGHAYLVSCQQTLQKAL